MKLHALFAAVVLTSLAALPALADEGGNEEAAAIAHRYGVEEFDRIEALKFTFNVREGTTTISRAWAWGVGSGKVSLATRIGVRPFTHALNLVSAAPPSPQDRRVAGWFESDRRWLLLPFQLINDRNADITLEEELPLPVPPGIADCLLVDPVETAHPPRADAYEIFYGPERFILQTVLRPNGAPSPSMVLVWSELARVGPIRVSLRRKTADGRTEMWFSDVAAKLAGGTDWIAAKPGR